MVRFLSITLVFMTLVVLPVRADQNDVKLSDLFRQLQSAPELTQAQLIERRIWGIWHTHTDPQVYKTMAVGVLSMRSGALKKALAAFDRIVAIDPNFAEGWNKRATIYYMMGRYTASVNDIQRALYLEPRHFGALSGLGLIFDAIGKGDAALKVWKQALAIHPNMPRIRSRMLELKRQLTEPPT